MNVDRTVENLVVPVTDLVEQGLPALDPTFGPDQARQQVEFHGSQRQRLRAESGRAGVEIQLQRSAADLVRRCRRLHRPGGTAQHRPKARQQLARRKGLGQIIVGTDFQPHNAVGFVAAGGQHQDGHVTAGADATQGLESVPNRQHDIENDCVPGDRRIERPFDSGAAVVDRRHFNPARTEVLGQQAAELQVIVDQKHANWSAIGIRHALLICAQRLLRKPKLWALLALGAWAAPAEGAQLVLAFRPEWSGRPIDVGAGFVGRTARGQMVRPTRISALLSNFALLRRDGSVLLLPGCFAWIDAGTQRWEAVLPAVAEGAYRGLRFEVGLPPAVDSSDPAQWAARHPLNPLVNGLYWGWRGGYVFFALEGRWWEEGGGAPAGGFSFHLTKNAGPMLAAVAVDFRVAGPTRISLGLDLAGLIRPLRFQSNGAETSTHSRPGDELASRLARAVPLAVGWRGAEPLARPIAVPGVELPAGTSYAIDCPPGFPQPDLPADNLPSAAGVALGSELFRDVRLSGNCAQSCATCHDPSRAFAGQEPVSAGADGVRGVRHSPSLMNLAWNPAYGWDGAKPKIRDQALAAITAATEMHGTIGVIAARLKSEGRMQREFEAAFGRAGISAETIGRALEQYLLTLVSARAKFDRATRGEAEFTAEEKRGMELFLTESDPARGQHGADCFHCHGGALFSDYAYRDDGLGEGAQDDAGRAGVSGAAWDRGKFKTPSLRNVAVAGPYMHDGRFATLEQVVAHYVSGVRRTPNLDPNLAKHGEAGLDLSVADQRALVAFLRTLTDVRFEKTGS